jgi:threonine/homoserine/homoserine lactone efflux protein
MIPGPNVALIVANSLRHGYRYGLVTVLGTTLGIALQLLLVIGGFSVLLGMAASALVWIRWLGVAYLVYLGIKTWSEAASDFSEVRPISHNGAFLRGVGLAVINPKTLLFNAAFLPQFVGQSMHITGQLTVLSGVFLLTIAVGDSLWVAFAGSARDWFRRVGRLRNRIAGGFLIGAGAGLALVRRNL